MASKPPKAATEAVNSEQLEALEGSQAAAGPSVGELEERTVEAEERAAAAQRENDELKDTIAKMEARLASMERAAKERRRAKVDEEEPLLPGEVPQFDETEPHGIVVGDQTIAYVQNGYQFGRDRQFIAREPNRGVPRAFNPKLVGWVKPRPGAAAFDPFEGIRDKNW